MDPLRVPNLHQKKQYQVSRNRQEIRQVIQVKQIKMTIIQVRLLRFQQKIDKTTLKSENLLSKNQ